LAEEKKKTERGRTRKGSKRKKKRWIPGTAERFQEACMKIIRINSVKRNSPCKSPSMF
jgi:hypothetical protein